MTHKLVTGVVTAGIAVFAALPFAASAQVVSEFIEEPSQTTAMNNIIQTFKRVGTAESTLFDYEDMDSSLFDFKAYVQHECFGGSLTVTAQRTCELEFGPFSNLREILMNDTLLDLLISDPELIATPQHVTALTLLIEAVKNDIIRAEAAGRFDRGSLEAQNLSDHGMQQLRDLQPTFSTALFPTNRTQPEADDSSAMRRLLRERSASVWSVCRGRYGDREALACYQDNLRLLDADTWGTDVRENIFYQPKMN